ncbi:hypothetical protein [uncultured Modestobacter sp.]|uniref:hypothetical protein n=1 Tax=uncultured Modestobacter sp. TaxID=380048 RepID=UPI00261032A3|nr:hypothetical protein [uncultured Modestobacter sp.]
MGTVDPRLLAATALALGALVFLGLRRAPRGAFAAWLVVLCLVPVWAGVQLVVFFQPQVLAGLAVLAALVPLRRTVRLTAADLVMVAFLVCALLPVALGGATVPAVFVLVAQWGGAFLLGRLLLHRLSAGWVYGAVAVAFTVVAVVAIVESVTGWNPFVAVPGGGDLHATWSTLQLRGGSLRAEGAFGHSIALGGSLALAIPLALAAPLPSAVRLPMVLLMGVACVLTISRIGLGTAALGIVLTLLFGRTGLTTRLRVGLAVACTAATVAVLPFLSGVFAAAGDEAADSASYRGDLLSLVGRMAPLGLSDSQYRSPTGEVFFGSFKSIDSALVLLGLTYGAIPLVLVLLGALLACGTVLRRRATPPTLALVAQLPAFATVALITQYATWAWFIAGLAVATQALRGAEPPSPADGAPDHPGETPSPDGRRSSPLVVTGR